MHEGFRAKTTKVNYTHKSKSDTGLRMYINDEKRYYSSSKYKSIIYIIHTRLLQNHDENLLIFGFGVEFVIVYSYCIERTWFS